MATTTETDRCEATSLGGGYNPRTYRCQQEVGHEGQCSYYRKGSQGGTQVYWWGVNPRPVGFLGDLGHSDLIAEVARLRRLCTQAGVDWTEGLSA